MTAEVQAALTRSEKQNKRKEKEGAKEEEEEATSCKN